MLQTISGLSSYKQDRLSATTKGFSSKQIGSSSNKSVLSSNKQKGLSATYSKTKRTLHKQWILFIKELDSQQNNGLSSTKKIGLFNTWSLFNEKLGIQQKKWFPSTKMDWKKRTLQQQRADSLQTKSSFFLKWSLFNKKERILKHKWIVQKTMLQHKKWIFFFKEGLSSQKDSKTMTLF